MEIKGIWHNCTTYTIDVTVNGEYYTGSIDAGGNSPIMAMSLTDLLTLRVNITNGTDLSSLVLLWQTLDLAHPSLLQQTARFGAWNPLPVVNRKPIGIYRFKVEQADGGLLIVGTVELVEGEVYA